MERITATYLIETPISVERAAATLAGEQSSGTFVSVPGESEKLKQRFAARIEQITPLETVRQPSLPGCRVRGNAYQRAEVIVSWSIENVGTNLPTIVSTVQGNLYELTQLSGLKLLDLSFPDSFIEHFAGPRWGIPGTRKLAGVENRPLIGTIIKPSVGLTPRQTAELVGVLADAGIDFIKDDELMADPPHAPFEARLQAIQPVIHDYAERTGKRILYAYNVSGEIDTMLRHYEQVVVAGGSCVMVSLNSVGLTGVKKLCDQGALAVHGHRNGWGMLNRHPVLGIEFPAYQKIWRLAGVDQIHVNGIQNKFWEPDDSVVRSIQACLKPMLGGYSILPVLSSGQWGGQAYETYRQTQTIDLLYLAGGGIMAHPDGPEGGVRALHRAWEAAVAGKTIEEAARESPELRRSIEKFGSSGKVKA
ncbi:MAG: ribulose-bisphosphate carboxylase large subunit family protein [Pirellulales bacterium]|nr:ribulose-bisphosphate carboxylase large subunit family protein [Pirellulales bacterium]